MCIGTVILSVTPSTTVTTTPTSQPPGEMCLYMYTVVRTCNQHVFSCIYISITLLMDYFLRSFIF